MKHKNITATILAAMAVITAQAQTLQPQPKLVVSIAIDQLRTDFVELFSPLFGNDGFKRLLGQGTVYSDASYPFAPIDRASAIATLSTGASPYYHGIVGTQWLDKSSLQKVGCVEDKKHPGIYTIDYTSPKNILTSTLGDELKMATNGAAIVYSIAPFKEAAILSAGHAADGAIWIDDTNGNWCSSTYYFKSAPKWFSAVNTLNKIQLPSKGIKLTDKTFSGNHKYRNFKVSSYVNASITDLALQCISGNAMGADNTPDLIALTYYAGAPSGQTKSQSELQETYYKLDKDLARLMSSIESSVGKQNVLFVVTSTGYFTEDNSSYDQFRIPTGTFYINRTANLLNIYLGAIFGQGRYVEGYFRNQIYLNHKLMEQRRISFYDVLGRCKELLIESAGVRDVFTSERLTTSGNPGIERIRNGYNSNCCGDILIEVAPGWTIQNEDTQDTFQQRASLIPFPIIIYGGNTPARRVETPVTADRIAPTIAKSIHIRAPSACGATALK